MHSGFRSSTFLYDYYWVERHENTKPDICARFPLDLGGYVTSILGQQRFPLRFNLTAVKSTGRIHDVEQMVSAFELVAEAFIALVKVEGIPVFALAEKVENQTPDTPAW